MKILRKLHIYFALALCWFLFFICFFGTSGYFKDEINYYMQPNLAKSIKNTEHSELAQALEFAIKKYENYEFIGIKTPPYFSNLFEINYYNRDSNKKEKKSNVTFFDKDEFIKNSTLGSKFLIGMHYKVLPSHGSLKTIFKAIISCIAAGLIVLIISGIFIWNKRFNLSGKNIYAKLYNFHIISGVFLALFLFWLSLSGIGINYIKDIENFFIPKTNKEYKNKQNTKLLLYSFDTSAILKAANDAKIRLNTDDLNIVLSKPNKSILITKSKNDQPIKNIKTKNNPILLYSASGELNEKISEKISTKELNAFAFLNELFFNTHRVPFAPFLLKLSLTLCAALACIFIYKSMQMSAQKRKSTTLNALANSAFFSSLNASLIYFIVNKILDNAELSRQAYEQNSFYISFIITFILSFIFAKNTKILRFLSVALFVILLVCDAMYSYYTSVTICFNIIYLIAIFLLLRSFYASANS